MKNKCLLFVLLLCAAVLLNACKKKADDVDPLSQLPAATQVGANTFGAIVNGKAFLPSVSAGHAYQCNYQYVKGDYFFTLAASNNSDGDKLYSINLGTDSLALVQGQTYSLNTYGIPKSANARYYIFYNIDPTNRYDTSEKSSGKLYISYFDPVKQIISGTFFFDAINKQGDIVHVTDGRFDMHYTQ